MSKYIIVKGKSLISKTTTGRRGTRQVFTSYKWSNDPRDAQTYGIGDAKEIASMCGGKVLPYSEITKFW